MLFLPPVTMAGCVSCPCLGLFVSVTGENAAEPRTMEILSLCLLGRGSRHIKRIIRNGVGKD